MRRCRELWQAQRHMKWGAVTARCADGVDPVHPHAERKRKRPNCQMPYDRWFTSPQVGSASGKVLMCSILSVEPPACKEYRLSRAGSTIPGGLSPRKRATRLRPCSFFARVSHQTRHARDTVAKPSFSRACFRTNKDNFLHTPGGLRQLAPGASRLRGSFSCRCCRRRPRSRRNIALCAGNGKAAAYEKQRRATQIITIIN